MSDYYEHLESAWNDLSKEDKEKFISSNIRQQQPIPQDINKWIEDEAEKRFPYAPKRFKDNWIAGANLLLPQLQAQQEEIKQLREKYRLLKSDYDLWLNRWQIDMDASKKTKAEQAAEIESLNQQIGQVKESLLFANDEIESLKRENEKMRIALSRILMGQNGQLKGDFIIMAQKLSREALKQQTHG